MFHIPVNNFAVKLESLLCWTITEQWIKYLAQGHNTVPSVRRKPATPLSEFEHSTTEPVDFSSRFGCRNIDDTKIGHGLDYIAANFQGVAGLNGKTREDFYKLLEEMKSKEREEIRETLTEELNGKEKALQAEFDAKRSELSECFLKTKMIIIYGKSSNIWNILLFLF